MTNILQKRYPPIRRKKLSRTKYQEVKDLIETCKNENRTQEQPNRQNQRPLEGPFQMLVNVQRRLRVKSHFQLARGIGPLVIA